MFNFDCNEISLRVTCRYNISKYTKIDLYNFHVSNW